MTRTARQFLLILMSLYVRTRRLGKLAGGDGLATEATHLDLVRVAPLAISTGQRLWAKTVRWLRGGVARVPSSDEQDVIDMREL